MNHERLRAWRTTRKLTQAQAAGALGVAPVTFREWESGRKPIRKLVWLALIGISVKSKDEALDAIMRREAA